MERKQLSFSFSFPSFFKRVKTEDATDDKLRNLPHPETERSLDSANRTARHSPGAFSSTRLPMAPPPSPAISIHKKTTGANTLPPSPRITPRTVDVCHTPKKVAFASTHDAFLEVAPLSPRPLAYGRSGAPVTASPRRSPNKLFKVTLNRHASQTTASSLGDFNAKENTQPTKEMSSSMEDVRLKNKTLLPRSSMAASLEEFLTSKNASPRRINFPFSSPRISTVKRPKNYDPPPIVETSDSHKEFSLQFGLEQVDQDLDAAFFLGGSTLNCTLETLQTTDTSNLFEPEPTTTPSVTENTAEIANPEANLAIEELRLKLSYSEEANAKLAAENSSLKGDLEAEATNSAQWEADYKALSERLLEAECAIEMLKKDSNELTEEFAQCKLDKSNIEGEMVELKAEVAALKFELDEKDIQIKSKEAENEALLHRLNEALQKITSFEEKIRCSEARNANLEIQLEELIKTNSETKEELSTVITTLEQERASLEAELSRAREDFRSSLENHQRLFDEEKLAHESTCSKLEEVKLKTSMLVEDIEKANETLIQLRQDALITTDEKFHLENRVHTLENELRICENAFESNLEKLSALETARKDLKVLLDETQAKLEQTLTEVDQSKLEIEKLQLANDEQRGKVESSDFNTTIKEEDTANDVMLVGVRPSSASPNTWLDNPACYNRSTVEATHYVNCRSPDMFEYNACFTCYSIRIALQTLKSSVDLNTLESLDKCSVSNGLMQAMAQAAESSQSHDGLCSILYEFNSKQSKDLSQENTCNRAAAYHDSPYEALGTNDFLEEDGEDKRSLFEGFFSLVNDVVKKSVGDYAEAMSILNELFNDVRALTMKYETTRALVEQLERDILAYKNLVCETLTSTSIIQQELENKLAVLGKENSAFKSLEHDLTQQLNSVRGELLKIAANETALKHHQIESEKAIEIYNERIIELETNLRCLEDKLEGAKDNEARLEATKKSLETELLATRNQVSLQNGDRIKLTKALSDIEQYQHLLENERQLHNAATASAAEYRERLAAVEKKLHVKIAELNEKQTRFEEQENLVCSVRRSLEAANQNIMVNEEKVKALESILRAKETELSSMVHRQNLAVTDSYKLREKKSKLTAENEKLKRDVQLLNTRIAEAEKRYLAKINTWNCSNVTPGQTLRPLVSNEVQQSSAENPVKTPVGAPAKTRTDEAPSAPVQPELNKDQSARPSSATPPIKKRLRLFDPNVHVKLEPVDEPTSSNTSQAIPRNSATPQGKGSKQRGNPSEGGKSGASSKNSRTIVNPNKASQMEEDDDEFQASATPGAARKTYSRAASKGANTPKTDKSGKTAPSTPQSTPTGSSRKRSKLGN